MRFDFAISFAGPQREPARKLSQLLREAGHSVFFDELFEHEMLGKDGADYFNQVFFSQSEHCIALVSRAYEERAWAQLERRAAQARELQHKTTGLLIPVLCDDVRPHWLLPTRIFFDLQQRPLEVLVQILSKRASSFPGGSYEITAQFEGLLGGDPLALCSAYDSSDFVVWSTFVQSAQQHPLRLTKSGPADQWQVSQMPVLATGRHLILISNLLISVPENSTDPVRLTSLLTGETFDIAVPRQRKWNSLTDCKFNGKILLLSYCGGDVWVVDTQTRRAVEIRPGSDEVKYASADWLSDRAIVTGDDHSNEVVIYDYFERSRSATFTAPEAVMSIGCFPSLHRIIVGGETLMAGYSYPEWRQEYRHELVQGVFDLCCAQGSAIYGFTSGMPLSGNVLEVWDASTGLRVLRERSGRDGGWKSCALARHASVLAVVAGRTVKVYEAGAMPTAQ